MLVKKSLLVLSELSPDVSNRELVGFCRAGHLGWRGRQRRKRENEPSQSASVMLFPFTCSQYACNNILACVHARTSVEESENGLKVELLCSACLHVRMTSNSSVSDSDLAYSRSRVSSNECFD